MDDFVQLAQGSTNKLNAVRNHLLHTVDEVLATPEDASRQEAISLKKLKKGDGSWATRKAVLGWILDTSRQTLELPAHRKTACIQLGHADLIVIRPIQIVVAIALVNFAERLYATQPASDRVRLSRYRMR